MIDPRVRLRQVRLLAGLLAILSLAIIAISAHIRLSGAGLGCSPWPDCYGQLLGGAANLHSGTARILHRSLAALALLLGFVLVARCLRPAPIQPAARYATVLLALMILLTFVGLFSFDPRRVWAGFINMLGGVGLALLSWRTALAAGVAPSPASRPAPLLHAGIVLLTATVALGALIGVRYAAAACLSLPACNGVAWPPAGGWNALNPFTEIVTAARPGDEGGVALHLLHRYCALATLVVLGLGGLRGLAEPATRGMAILLLALLLAQFALGVLTVMSGFSLALAIAHSVCAAALLATTLHLLVRRAG